MYVNSYYKLLNIDFSETNKIQWLPDSEEGGIKNKDYESLLEKSNSQFSNITPNKESNYGH